LTQPQIHDKILSTYGNSSGHREIILIAQVKLIWRYENEIQNRNAIISINTLSLSA